LRSYYIVGNALREREEEERGKKRMFSGAAS
jgi:hypothetical protein